MQKIPTLFLRNPDDRRYVMRGPHPDCLWVLDGEGIATRKYDGTCVMFDGERWWARREVKPRKQTPPNYQPIGFDDTTGKTVGWEPVEQSAFAKYHAEALANGEAGADTWLWLAGTYELCGPKVNGDPEVFGRHILLEHARAERLADAPRDFDGLVKYLDGFDGEGIVWHHPDGRMAKLKWRDFPR
jgi:hypothetical protein